MYRIESHKLNILWVTSQITTYEILAHRISAGKILSSSSLVMRTQLDQSALDMLLPLRCMFEPARAAVHCSLCSRVALQNCIGCVFDYFLKCSVHIFAKFQADLNLENGNCVVCAVCPVLLVCIDTNSIFSCRIIIV